MAIYKTDRMETQRIVMPDGRSFVVHALLKDFMGNWIVENEDTGEKLSVPYIHMKRFIPQYKLDAIRTSFMMA